MQVSITSVGPSSTHKPDGSLLLQVDRGLILSINSIATLIWVYLEQNPKGVTVPEIVNHVEASCSNAVLRSDIERDVGELLKYLEERQVIKKRIRRNSGELYRIGDGVLRTQNNALTTLTARQELSGEAGLVHDIKRLLTPVSKDPSLGSTVQEQIAEINNYQSAIHTIIALLTFAAYDTLLKLLGFHRICRIITRNTCKRRSIDALRALQICTGIERARIWYPKQIMCMQHSVVIKFLLGRCGLNTNVAIAGRSMPFQSHAWVELEGIVINDTQKVQQFYRVFTYL